MLRNWSSSTSWIPWFCCWVCQTVFFNHLSHTFFKSELTVLHQLSFILVLFPFLEPALQKMNISFFPADVTKFFYDSLDTIKVHRSKNKNVIQVIYCCCKKFNVGCGPVLENRSSEHLYLTFVCFFSWQNRVDFMQLMVDSQNSHKGS